MTIPASSSPPAWTLGTLARALGVGCFAVGVGAGVGYLISHERPPGSGRGGPPADVSAGAHPPPPPGGGAGVPPPPPSPGGPLPPADSAGAHPTRPTPAGAAELGLLAPLREGGALGGFTVTEIDAVDADGQLRIVLGKAGTVVELDVALNVDAGPAPPAVAGRYAVFYSSDGTPHPDAEALAHALGEVLEANASTPAPPGMAPFAPRRQ